MHVGPESRRYGSRAYGDGGESCGYAVVCQFEIL